MNELPEHIKARLTGNMDVDRQILGAFNREDVLHETQFGELFVKYNLDDNTVGFGDVGGEGARCELDQIPRVIAHLVEIYGAEKQ